MDIRKHLFKVKQKLAKRNNYSINKAWARVSFLFAVLSLFYSINSDTIVQHNDNILSSIAVPFSSLFLMDNEEISINDVLSDESTNNSSDIDPLTYIFVIDRSGSINWQNAVPTWYNKAVFEVNNRIANNQFSYLEYNINKKRPSGFEICQVKLSKLLFDIENKKDRFAVWKVGNFGDKIYPVNGTTASSTQDNIDRALKTIKELNKTKKEMNTDFTDLFTKLFANYPLNTIQPTLSTSPSYILVIISDLIHDVKKKLSRLNNGLGLMERVQADTIKLNQNIKALSESNLLANIVVLSAPFSERNKDDYKFNIEGKLEKYFQPQCYEKIAINQNLDKLLYSQKISDKNIIFYYASPFIKKSSFLINIKRYGYYSIRLKRKVNSDYDNLGILEYQVLNSKGRKKEGEKTKGILTRNYSLQRLELQEGEKIKLTYSGRVPNYVFAPELKIYLPKIRNRKYCYSLDIIFKKKLSKLNASMMLIFLLIFLVNCVYLFLLYSVKYKYYYGKGKKF